jgi:6-phosphogluconolactonase (cycloisomerase 2 family)
MPTRRIFLQSLGALSVLGLAPGANKAFFFAVNEISEYQGLPAGSVESWAIHPVTGLRTLISRQSLSLSATMPKSLALSPDRRHIVVAVYGGGCYNVLPVSTSGQIGPVTQVFKEIGSGPHRKQSNAHPHSLLFHPSGQFLITTDLGADRISVFRFQEGRMTRVHQVKAPAGSGPAQLEMNPAGSKFLVHHHFTPLRRIYQFNQKTGQLT